MKNVNINVVFSNLSLNPDNKRLSLFDISNELFVSIDKEEQKRIIKHISMAVMVSATQSKDIQYVAKLNSDETFVFNEKYELQVRLTETTSGRFKDLGFIEIDPSENDVYEGICRHTFNKCYLGLYDNISLPEEKEGERFVVKILIRHKNDQIEPGEWNVQTVFPITFNSIETGE